MPRNTTVKPSRPDRETVSCTETSRNVVVPFPTGVGMSVYGEGLADLAFDGLEGGDLFLLEREVLFVSLVVGAGAKAALLAKSSSC